MKCSRALGGNQGSDSIQLTQRGQNGIDGVRLDIVQVIERGQPSYPDERGNPEDGDLRNGNKNYPAGKTPGNRMGRMMTMNRTASEASGRRKK
jgi:hypothetical protein